VVFFKVVRTKYYIPKSIPNIFNCNIKKDYQILTIFGMNTAETASHQMTIQFLTLSGSCLCTTWGKQNQWNITFYPIRYVYL